MSEEKEVDYEDTYDNKKYDKDLEVDPDYDYFADED